MISLCRDWEFVPEFSLEFARGEGSGEVVQIPHCPKIMPLHYAKPADYEMVCGYRKKLVLTKEQLEKRLYLQFDGAAHRTKIYINGEFVKEHRCGYTAFRVSLNKYVKEGENIIAAGIDSRETGDIPPFGLVIDYLTFAGLYREVWLDEKPQNYIRDVFVQTPNVHTAIALVTLDLKKLKQEDDRKLKISIISPEGKVVAESGELNINSEDKKPVIAVTMEATGVESWNTKHPVRYVCRTVIMNGEIEDANEVLFGFRTAKFHADGFYLNGKKVFMRGLNRHQSYPFIGYAATESLQREDARILQEELGCNAVRTSHYPQSQYFLDECDKRGILVFTEFPGWQHLGDAAWKEQVLVNEKDMILQNRNHPSIVLWGVRINESQDDDELYRRTNALAHRLDPSRATSGVRYLQKSHLLEDVYAYNDFSHDGTTPGARPKKTVTPDKNKALLISECNGHMYPTKPGDNWARRQEHALRHARVQDAARGSGEHAGCFGWCMFDYPTHGDFGSGDRMCYHGVMDSFRNPKLAAALYESQSNDHPVLEIGSSMDIGDYPAGHIGKVFVFTNADEVRLYKNDLYVTTMQPGGWKGLKHGPIEVKDTIGELVASQENFGAAKAKHIHDLLLEASKYDIGHLPPHIMAKVGATMARYHMSFEDCMELYGKYVANWGGIANVWRFEAVKDGEVVKSVTCGPGSTLHLEVKVSTPVMSERDTYDMCAVRVRLLDEHDHPAVYASIPVKFEVSGAAEIVGPDIASFEGGMSGTYLKTNGNKGPVKLKVSCGQTEPVEILLETV